jgi:hypothetical protein
MELVVLQLLPALEQAELLFHALPLGDVPLQVFPHLSRLLGLSSLHVEKLFVALTPLLLTSPTAR